MFLSQTISIPLGLAFVFLSGCLLVALTLLTIVVIWLYRQKKQKRQLETEFYGKGERILKEAEEKAHEIIEKALNEAKDIKAEIKSKEEEAGKKFLEIHSQKLNKISADLLSGFERMAANATGQEVDFFAKAVKEKVDRAYEEASARIKRFEEAKEQEVSERANELVKKICGEVLKRTLSEKEQEELIFTELEKAKKEGLFKG